MIRTGAAPSFWLGGTSANSVPNKIPGTETSKFGASRHYENGRAGHTDATPGMYPGLREPVDPWMRVHGAGTSPKLLDQAPTAAGPGINVPAHY